MMKNNWLIEKIELINGITFKIKITLNSTTFVPLMWKLWNVPLCTIPHESFPTVPKA
jgi:hypothetical protein